MQSKEVSDGGLGERPGGQDDQYIKPKTAQEPAEPVRFGGTFVAQALEKKQAK